MTSGQNTLAQPRGRSHLMVLPLAAHCSSALQGLIGHLGQLAQRELDHTLAPTFMLIQDPPPHLRLHPGHPPHHPSTSGEGPLVAFEQAPLGRNEPRGHPRRATDQWTGAAANRVLRVGAVID